MKKLRQQQLKNQNLDPSFQANEIEKMTAQRAEVFNPIIVDFINLSRKDYL